MTREIILKVNGKEYSALVSAETTLLEVLREQLNLTGTKSRCNNGECGVCTIICDGLAVNSCLLLAVEAVGKDIITIEGLAKNGQLHPLQQAFIDKGAIQCGYCTPGMIMSAKALLDRTPHPTEAEIKEAIAGNLCRCTGYSKIVEAILEVCQHE